MEMCGGGEGGGDRGGGEGGGSEGGGGDGAENSNCSTTTSVAELTFNPRAKEKSAVLLLLIATTSVLG